MLSGVSSLSLGWLLNGKPTTSFLFAEGRHITLTRLGYKFNRIERERVSRVHLLIFSVVKLRLVYDHSKILFFSSVLLFPFPVLFSLTDEQPRTSLLARLLSKADVCVSKFLQFRASVHAPCNLAAHRACSELYASKLCA